MAKYTEDVKTQCVEALRAGKSISEVSKEFGPNPKAVERYAKKEGITVAKKVRAPKDPNAPKKEKKAKASKKKVTEDEVLED